MNGNDKPSGGIKLLDAVDALTIIADADLEQEFDLPEEMDSEINWRNPSWLKSEDKPMVIANIKNIFKVILNHLKDSYQENSTHVNRVNDVEGIKNIMVVVGEAAKKIDRFTDLFRNRKSHSITEIREYQQLQEFYKKKISKSIDEATLGKWILALTFGAFKASDPGEKLLDTKHVFVDLESVKNDTEYELFFIRKADGTRFFSPRLIRNIKLICDFGFNISQERDKDPLIDLPIWSDRFGFARANFILEGAKPILMRYYPMIIHHKDMPFFSSLHKALLALHLAASKEKLLSNGALKGCLSYLADFQIYLREALESRIYQNMMAFREQEWNHQEVAAKKIIEALLKQVFEGKMGDERLNSYVHFIINESKEALSLEHRKAINLDNPIWSTMACDFAAMQKYLRHHPNGPLDKVLKLLEEGNYSSFDPYMQLKLPEKLFKINFKGLQTSIHRLASPTKQELINQASAIEEWLGYLSLRQEDEGNVLLINFQDNTSWREHARAEMLEGLQEGTSFSKFLSVVTLPKDTEFYYQDMPYQEDNQFHIFQKQISSQVLGEHTGFYFPEKIKNQLTKEWIDGITSIINRIFFSGKNVLSKEARMDFIEIFYAFLELKALEITNATDLFFTCKDGIDVSPTSAGLLYYLLKELNGEKMLPSDTEALSNMIYLPALLFRERVPLKQRMERMLSAVKILGNTVHELNDTGVQASLNQALSPYFRLDLSQNKAEKAF